MISAARHASLGELLDEAWLTYPSDVACIEVDRDRETVRLSYADVRRLVRRVAGGLAARGLGPDARVAIVASNQHGWLVAAAAILRLGAVIVPLDARLTADEQQALLDHARVDALVTEPHLLVKLPRPPALTVVFGEARGAIPWAALAEADADAPVAPRTRDDLACIVYSSGTGGAAKGCLIPHGAYLAQYDALAATFDWKRGDRYFSVLPTNHAIDFLCGFVAAWATGATVIHQRALRPEHLVATMRRYRVTQMAVVPLILKAFERALDERLDEAPPERRRLLDGLVEVHQRLTERAPSHTLARWLLKPVHDGFGGHLRVLFCGGAFTERRLAERFAGLGLPVAIGYGLTEACTVATVNDLKPFRGDTVGAPVPGVRVRIVDPGPDGVGEVQITGPTLFRGYLDDPEQTAAAFDGPWLRTGDLGWIDAAHHLHLVGRRKNMIVTPGGKNVYPEDVEAALDTVPADELAVLAADYVWPRGSLVGEELLVVVRTTDRTAARAALVARNRALPEHKRCGLVLWTDREFPRTASLKVKRADLADRLRAEHPRDAAEVLA